MPGPSWPWQMRSTGPLSGPRLRRCWDWDSDRSSTRQTAHGRAAARRGCRRRGTPHAWPRMSRQANSRAARICVRLLYSEAVGLAMRKRISSIRDGSWPHEVSLHRAEHRFGPIRRRRPFRPGRSARYRFPPPLWSGQNGPSGSRWRDAAELRAGTVTVVARMSWICIICFIPQQNRKGVLRGRSSIEWARTRELPMNSNPRRAIPTSGVGSDCHRPVPDSGSQ